MEQKKTSSDNRETSKTGFDSLNTKISDLKTNIPININHRFSPGNIEKTYTLSEAIALIPTEERTIAQILHYRTTTGADIAIFKSNTYISGYTNEDNWIVFNESIFSILNNSLFENKNINDFEKTRNVIDREKTDSLYFYTAIGGSLQIFKRLDAEGMIVPISKTAEHYYLTCLQRAPNGCGVIYLDKDKKVLGYDLKGTGSPIIYEGYELVRPIDTEYLAISSIIASQGRILKLEVFDYPINKTETDVVVEDLETRVSKLEEADISLLNIEVEQKTYINVRNKSIAETEAYISGGGTPHWYGVEYIEEDTDADNVTRISSLMDNGVMPLHIADNGLPIQQMLRRCVFIGGEVNYYLDANNSLLKEDGVSPSNLSGDDGDFEVEIPNFWYDISVSETTFNGEPATKVTAKFSKYYIEGFQFHAKSYTSAVEASINWTFRNLRSVVMTNFKSKANHTGYFGEQLLTGDVVMVDTYKYGAENYRGAANNSQFDNVFNEDSFGLTYDSNYFIPADRVDSETQINLAKYIKCGLGRPFSASNGIGRETLRKVARKNGTRYNIYLYDNHKAIFWLMLCEFATRDLQKDLSNVRTAEGYTTGGCGRGACTLNFNDYEGYKINLNGVTDLAALSLIPCGSTSKLGNKTGEVLYYIPYYPTGSGSGQGGTWKITGYKPQILKVNSYRGIENPYGHTYKICDQINIQMNQTYRKIVNGLETGEFYDGAAKANIKQYYTPYASACEEKINSFYEKVSEDLTEDYCIYYVKNLVIGDKGHILPKKTKGKSNLYYKDITEFYVGNRQQSIKGEVSYMTWAGRVCNKDFCGMLFSFCNNSGDTTRASDTTRLDYK